MGNWHGLKGVFEGVTYSGYNESPSLYVSSKSVGKYLGNKKSSLLYTGMVPLLYRCQSDG